MTWNFVYVELALQSQGRNARSFPLELDRLASSLEARGSHTSSLLEHARIVFSSGANQLKYLCYKSNGDHTV